MLAAGVNISGRIPILLLSLLVVLDRNLPYQFTRFLGLFCTFSSSQLSIALHRKTCGGRQRAECPFRQKKNYTWTLQTSKKRRTECPVLSFAQYIGVPSRPLSNKRDKYRHLIDRAKTVLGGRAYRPKSD
jgi:hypothetical protein